MKVEEFIEKKTKEILELIDVGAEIVTTVEEGESQEENLYSVKINGRDLNFLIGKHGDSLNSLQTLLGQMVHAQYDSWVNLLVDINDYRDRRQEKLYDMAKSYIDRVRFHRKEVTLPPMNSYERRLVHIFVQEYPDVRTESIGVGSSRRVVLKPSSIEDDLPVIGEE